MPNIIREPLIKRAVSFIDGQNLYRHAKEAFGYHVPNYDPSKLHAKVCEQHGWAPSGVRFYTGIPVANRQPSWHGFWANKTLAMTRAGVMVFKREIRYRTEDICLPDQSIWEYDFAQEKGVDVRLAIDVMRLAIHDQFDVAVIFSQDQDLTEVVAEIKEITRATGRWIKVVSAFPASSSATAYRGIDKTDWFRMEKDFYDKCLDPRDYRKNDLPWIAPVPPLRLKEAAPDR